VLPKKKDIPKEHLPAYSESRAKSRKGRKAVESVGDEYGGHQVNTRVVFFADGGKEIHGVLKFLGHLSIIDDTVWAVVETDKNFLNDKAGSACKHFKEFKVLKIRTNHALVVFPEELMKEDNFYGQIQVKKEVTSSNTNINPSPSREIPSLYLENTTELEVRQPALPDLASLPDLPQVTMKKPQPKPRTMIKTDAKIEEPVKPSSVSHKDDIVGEQTEMKNEVFKNFEDQCTCAICLELADEAVVCSHCHQVFCQKCIVGLEGCPSCRQNPFTTQPNVNLRRLIGSMTTNCTNEGCKERPTRSNLTSHLEKCEWSTIECPNDGCDQNYQKFGSEQHKRQCVYRSEACIGCGHQYKMLDLANHQDQCLFVDVPCMNSNCNERFLRKDESSHISVCKQQIIRCSFCFFSDTRIQVLHHTIDIHYQEAVRLFGASSHQP